MVLGERFGWPEAVGAIGLQGIVRQGVHDWRRRDFGSAPAKADGIDAFERLTQPFEIAAQHIGHFLGICLDLGGLTRRLREAGADCAHCTFDQVAGE